jgi:hypothetical protein
VTARPQKISLGETRQSGVRGVRQRKLGWPKLGRKRERREPDLGGVATAVFLGRALLLRIQAERFELPTPFRRSIAAARC